MCLYLVIAATGVVITSSVCPPVMSQGVGIFSIQHDAGLPPQPQLTYQAGPQLRITSKASEIYPQPVPWMVPSSCVPPVSIHNMSTKTAGPTEQMSFLESSSFPQHTISSTFHGLIPDVSSQSGFPGSSVAVFEGGSAVLTSVQPAFLGLPRSRDVPGPPQLQPTARHDDYLRDQEEFALGKQQLYRPAVLSAPNSLLTQQAALRPPAHLVEVLPAAQPRTLVPLPQDDPTCLASIPLPLDQQPVRLLLPPVMPPRPPSLLLTSGQPSNVPTAVAAPLSVVQETPSVALQPVLPMPAQFRMDHPPVSMHMHEVSRPGLETEQSPIKLLPPFQSDLPVHGRPPLNMMLQEMPNRPPVVGRMLSLGPAGEMPIGQQSAVLDVAPRMIRPHLMPKSPKPLLGMELHQFRLLPPAPEFVQELPEVQAECEPQSDSEFGLHGTSDQLSIQLHSEYPRSSMLPNQAREMQQQSDRHVGLPVKPLMAPGQVLEALQRLPAPETRQLLGQPPRNLLQTDLSPMRAMELRPPEFGGVPRMTFPIMESNELPTDEHLEQHGASFSGSTFSSRLPTPAAVMASPQIIGSSSLPNDRFQSDFGYCDIDDRQESDSSLLDPHGSASLMDRIGPLSHVASASSKNVSSVQPLSERMRVPSLLDENLLALSRSSCFGLMHRRAPVPTRQRTGRSGGGLLSAGDLKAIVRPRGDWSRRRTFHQFSGADEDCAPVSYEPPTKLVRSDEDTAAEPEDVPAESTAECDGNDDGDKVTVSSSIDTESTAAVTEPSGSFSTAELS